jgi:crossover junction endodeoxyribonuclease RuvC
MVILAFDSGVERTGYAVLDHDHGDPEVVAYDCIFTSKDDLFTKRLMQLRDEVEKLIVLFSPDVCVMERLFFNKNTTTALMVAQAQGAILSLLGQHEIPTEFITPQQIKQSLTGYGNADKKSVQKMVQILLKLEAIPQPDDTADALACALTYCTMRTFNDRQN